MKARGRQARVGRRRECGIDRRRHGSMSLDLEMYAVLSRLMMVVVAAELCTRTYNIPLLMPQGRNAYMSLQHGTRSGGLTSSVACRQSLIQAQVAKRSKSKSKSKNKGKSNNGSDVTQSSFLRNPGSNIDTGPLHTSTTSSVCMKCRRPKQRTFRQRNVARKGEMSANPP